MSRCPPSITFSFASAALGEPSLSSPGLAGAQGERVARDWGDDAAPTWNKLVPGSSPQTPAFPNPPHTPRSLRHHRGPGPVSLAWGKGKKQKRERNESCCRAGRGAVAGHCPAPLGQPGQVLGARCHPAPPVSPPTPGGTEAAFSPLPAPCLLAACQRRKQGGRLSPSAAPASTGTLSPQAPHPAPAPPCHRQPPARHGQCPRW